MKQKNKEYVLAYGFRRLSACKKLGYKTIPAMIKGSDKIEDVSIENIEVIDNTRLETSEAEVTELMQSIKQSGLLQPIGIWESDKLDEKDFFILNLTENLHRKDITPFELAKACTRLKELGLNLSEIAVRLAMPVSRIRTVMEAHGNLSEGWEKLTDFKPTGRTKTGKVSVTTANAIGLIGLNNSEKNTLLEYTHKNELSHADVLNIRYLLTNGMSLQKAIKKSKDYQSSAMTLIFVKKELEKLKEEGKINSMREYVREVLRGDRRPIKGLVY